jgi:hypothetical protein
MKRKIFSLPSSLSLQRARASAASYRIVGQPARAGSLTMARLGSSTTPFWQPSLLDTLRAPLTRLRD